MLVRHHSAIVTSSASKAQKGPVSADDAALARNSPSTPLAQHRGRMPQVGMPIARDRDNIHTHLGAEGNAQPRLLHTKKWRKKAIPVPAVGNQRPINSLHRGGHVTTKSCVLSELRAHRATYASTMHVPQIRRAPQR